MPADLRNWPLLIPVLLLEEDLRDAALPVFLFMFFHLIGPAPAAGETGSIA
jgi:hypothetical protein